MTFWDFDENKNYKIIKYNNNLFKVLRLQHSKLVAKRLYQAKFLINILANLVYNNLNKVNNCLRNMSIIFLSIHPYYYYVQEMQLDTQFEGLNKPKAVKNNYILPVVGKDSILKASYRVIFLKIRDSHRIKTFAELIPLILHEVAHTGCNHVRWRDDDHGEDFQLFEEYLYFLLHSILQ
jgi:hypothetical protein